MKKRKDSSGKVLKDGESERKDGRYQYRYTDTDGKRKTVYARTLDELRKKEQKIQNLVNSGLITNDGTTVAELVEKYVGIRQASVKLTTYEQLSSFADRIKKDRIGFYKIGDVTTTAAKTWVTTLYRNGLSYGTINNFKAIMKPAFDMALDDNLIAKNPFSFNLSKVIQNHPVEKKPITNDEYTRLLLFARGDKRFYQLADQIVLLYETGIRVSEMCGLTFNDIDLEDNIIKIERQVIRTNKHPRYIETPKTEKGRRVVPLSPAAKESILNLSIDRPHVKEEKTIDGCSDFLLITKTGLPKVGSDVATDLRQLIALYNKVHPDNQLPHITPHTFRHTFCTRLVLSGMNVKTIQYIMGHSTVSVTLDIYSHIMSSADVVKEFEERLPVLGCTPTNKILMSAASKELLTPELIG